MPASLQLQMAGRRPGGGVMDPAAACDCKPARTEEMGTFESWGVRCGAPTIRDRLADWHLTHPVFQKRLPISRSPDSLHKISLFSYEAVSKAAVKLLSFDPAVGPGLCVEGHHELSHINEGQQRVTSTRALEKCTAQPRASAPR